MHPCNRWADGSDGGSNLPVAGTRRATQRPIDLLRCEYLVAQQDARLGIWAAVSPVEVEQETGVGQFAVSEGYAL